MAIPLQGTRGINVDGVPYRWRIRSQPTYEQACHHGKLTVGVEWADSRSLCVLVLESEFTRPDGCFGPHSEPITPQIIADSIRAAVVRGWQPGVKGAAFRHALLAGAAERVGE
jgi:hypothetical protein